MDYIDAAAEDRIVHAFYTRDIYHGRGLRGLAYDLLLDEYSRAPGYVVRALHLLPKYGSWFDLYRMLDSRGRYRVNGRPGPTDPCLAVLVADLYAAQLLRDERSEGVPSLAAKWAPQEGKRYHWFAKMLADRMGSNEKKWKEYRRVVSKLRQRLAARGQGDAPPPPRWYEGEGDEEDERERERQRVLASDRYKPVRSALRLHAENFV